MSLKLNVISNVCFVRSLFILLNVPFIDDRLSYRQPCISYYLRRRLGIVSLGVYLSAELFISRIYCTAAKVMRCVQRTVISV